MSHEINEAIQAILANGQVPPRVTNRLLMAIMIELANRQDRTEKAVTALTERVAKVETYPSVTALFWKHPKSTIAFIVFLFGLLVLAYQAGGVFLP